MDCSMPGFPDLHYLLELLKLMSIESVMPPNYLILANPFSSCPPSFPASGSFPRSQFFASSSQSIGASVSASVLPVNIQESLVHIWNFRWPYRNLPQETAASCLREEESFFWQFREYLTLSDTVHSAFILLPELWVWCLEFTLGLLNVSPMLRRGELNVLDLCFLLAEKEQTYIPF